MLKNRESLSESELRLMQPVVLAYIGDAVYELMCRLHVTCKGAGRIKNMHRETVDLVRAHHQAALVQALEGEFTPEEQDIIRKGRNVKSHVPRSSDPAEYRSATGFEALIGYLYLAGQEDRLCELFDKMMSFEEEKAE